MPNFCSSSANAIHADGPLSLTLMGIGAGLFLWLLIRIGIGLFSAKSRDKAFLPAILFVIVIALWMLSLTPPLPFGSGITTAARFYGLCGKG